MTGFERYVRRLRCVAIADKLVSVAIRVAVPIGAGLLLLGALPVLIVLRCAGYNFDEREGRHP